MPMFIHKVTSEVVVQEAGGLDRQQMSEIVAEVLRALREEERECQEIARAAMIRENSRPETLFE